MTGAIIVPPVPSPWLKLPAAVSREPGESGVESVRLISNPTSPWLAGVTRSPVAAPVAAPAGKVRRIGAAIGLDRAYAFALFIPLLFMLQLGTAGAALFVGLACAYAIARRRRLGQIFASRGFLLLLPALAMVSVTWSEAPAVSLQASAELLVTAVGALLLTASARASAVLQGLFISFLIYVLVSLGFGHTVAVGMTGEAFAGLNGGKNLLGDIAASGLLISAAVFVGGLGSRARWWSVAAALAIPIEAYAMIASRSAGALLGLAFGALTLGLLLAVTPLRRSIRIGLLTLAALSGGAAYLAARWVSESLVGAGAGLFSKDSTLTGRTYLWYRADDLIAERPWLGRGFAAFWRQGNLDAEGLWRYAGISTRGGFTFHNTLVEILVQLGWVGFAVILAVAATGAVLIARKVVMRPSVAFCCWASLFVYEMVRTPIESVGVSAFYFSTVLTFAAIGAALTREA